MEITFSYHVGHRVQSERKHRIIEEKGNWGAEFIMKPEQIDPEEFVRWERIAGVIYDMTPSPSAEHQRVVTRLIRDISGYLKGKECESFVAPFDVYLDGEEAGDCVQPDITIICDPNKIQRKGCVGAPDMVVEVLSPRTAKKDKTTKLMAYKRAGLRECWIVDPYNQTVEIYLFAGVDHVFPTVYNRDDTVNVSTVAGLTINLQDIFD